MRLHLDSVCVPNVCSEVKLEKWKERTPTMICVGAMSERKNQLEVIKAVQLLILEGIFVHVYLLGKSNNVYSQKCIEYIVQNNLSNWIEVKGFVSTAENEIAKCDALICGSVVESFPNVIGTAMASRTIVISTPVGGVTEILEDNKNAYLCDGFDGKDIYTAIRRFCVERGTQAQKNVVENAFQTYVKELSPGAIADKLLSYYKHVCIDNATRRVSEVSMAGLLDSYSSYIELLKKHEASFKKRYKVRNMIWLIPYIKRSLDNKPHSTLIIWGAGLYGAEAKVFAELFFPELSIYCFIDKEKEGKYLGVPIMKLDDIDWGNSLIWIAFVYGQSEAIETLTDMGLEYHADFFFLAPMNL